MKDEMTTNEIFQESMKLSEPAYKEKGEKLVEYQKWLRKKWKCVGEAELKEPEFHYDFYDEKGLTARGEDKLREDREAREK